MERLVELAKDALEDLDDQPNETSKYLAKIRETRENLRRLAEAVLEEADDAPNL